MCCHFRDVFFGAGFSLQNLGKMLGFTASRKEWKTSRTGLGNDVFGVLCLIAYNWHNSEQCF